MLRLFATISLTIGIACLHCLGSDAHAQAPVQIPDTVDHSAFAHVLSTYVDEEGDVAYEQLAGTADSVLTPYLQMLATTNPVRLDRSQRLAFWINAYNAYTIKLIVDHYPVTSIKDITSDADASRPNANSPFLLNVGTVADTVRSLDDIEHGIIRERFEEPRIHFALVCAAVSCPALRREPYTGDALDRQLAGQAHAFLQNDAKNRIPEGARRIAVSRIFKGFDDDFGRSDDALQRILSTYFEGDVRKRLAKAAYRVRILDYDWTLNDQARSEDASVRR